MIPQQEDLNGMLEEMLNIEPENRFYQSLQKQYRERKTLTPRQVECLQEDYKEKINNNTQNPAQTETPAQTNKVAPATTECVLQHPHTGPHEYTKNTTISTPHTDVNWKNNIAPDPETISQQPSLEDFMQNYLSSPDYGTREKITDTETIKAIISLIKNRSATDHSHYHGYNSKLDQEAKYQKTTLVFKDNQMYKNGMPLECKFDDPQFDGMRINSYRDSIQILLDFFDPEEGYSKKCVIFNIRRGGNYKEDTSTSNRNTDADKTANNSNFALTDTRNRTKQQLENEYGTMNQAKAIALWNTSKISYTEYEQFIPAAEKETSQQETKEQEADAANLMPIENTSGTHPGRKKY